MNTVFLSKTDKKVIINWFESYSMDSQHYGNGLVTFPDEQKILLLLHNEDCFECDLTDHQIDIIFSWLENSIHKKFGNVKYLLPDEKEVYTKIVNLYNQIMTDENSRIECHNKLKTINDKISRMIIDNENRKSRSFEDKMKAANKLKEDRENKK